MEGISIHFSFRGGVTRNVLERFFTVVRTAGMEFDSNTGDDRISYKGDSTDRTWVDLHPEEAISRFASERDHSAFRVQDPEIPIRYTINQYSDQIDLHSHQNYWRGEFSESQAVTESILDLVTDAHRSLSCKHIRTLLQPIPEFERIRERELRGEWEYETVDKISWLTVFGPEGIERHGRERLLSAPGWRVKEISDNGVLLVMTESPADLPAYKRQYNAIRSHLGLDHLPEATLP